MKPRRLLAAILAVLVTVPMYADFASLASAIDAQHGVNRIWIPFLGIARIAVRIAQPEGVHDFQLATFEGAERLDPTQLKALVKAKIGPGFTPLVQVWSKKKGEWSFIYARPNAKGTRMELVVLAHDDDETVLVRVDVDADKFARELGEPRGVSKVARQ